MAIGTALNSLYGCGPLGPAAFENYSEISGDFFMNVWAQTEELAEADIDLNGYTISIFTKRAEVEHACGAAPRIGCADTKDRRIVVLGNVEWGAACVGGIFAHELGHVHYAATELNPDRDHIHSEWFAEEGPSVVGLIRRRFEFEWN